MRREGFELQVSRPDIVTKEIDGKIDRAGRGAGHRRRRGLPGRRHRAGRRAPRHDDQDGQQRQRPRAARVPDPGARADRLPLAVPDRHQGHRHHEPHLRRAGSRGTARSRRARPARWSPTAPAWRPPTRSSTCRSAARSSSTRPTQVYEGMIIGENSRASDMDVNVTQGKEADQHARLVAPTRRSA